MRHLFDLVKPLTIITMIFLVGCSCAPLKKTDPLECFNRGVYGLNKGLDFILIRPTARIYQKILPSPVKVALGNFFQNLREIPTMGNDVLQGRWQDARIASTRFVLNTTLGLGGLLDVAETGGLKNHTNDFGITLANWGIVESIYIVLPILGPSTARDTVGLGVTYYMSVYPYIHPPRLRYSLLGLTFIDARADFIRHEGAFVEAAVDEYKLVRDAYIQHRDFEIKGEQETSPISTTDTSLHTDNTSTSVELQGPPP